MSLRLEWDAEHETPQLLELALVDRFNTARQLLTIAEWDAAIYFFGYVAQMVLKTAYFRVHGNRLTDRVKEANNLARRSAQYLIPNTIEYESYHSLLFWAELLKAERRRLNRSLPAMIEMNLSAYIPKFYT